MAKGKKKHSKKDKVSESILDMAALSLKKFRKVTKEIGKLSTSQKVVGGCALLAIGYTYLAGQNTEAATPAPGSRPAPLLLGTAHHHRASDEENAGESAPPSGPPRKSRKSPRAKSKGAADVS